MPKTINELRKHAQYHEDLAYAYSQGHKTAEEAYLQGRKDAIDTVKNFIREPETCANPKAQLSKASKAQNRLLRAIIGALSINPKRQGHLLATSPERSRLIESALRQMVGSSADNDIPF